METTQIDTMFKIARQTNNLSDIRRLQKIKEFNNPSYKYETSRKRRSILGYPKI